jgi:hypothetical protein
MLARAYTILELRKHRSLSEFNQLLFLLRVRKLATPGRLVDASSFRRRGHKLSGHGASLDDVGCPAVNGRVNLRS